jgi:hypothetical protein
MARNKAAAAKKVVEIEEELEAVEVTASPKPRVMPKGVRVRKPTKYTLTYMRLRWRTNPHWWKLAEMAEMAEMAELAQF